MTTTERGPIAVYFSRSTGPVATMTRRLTMSKVGCASSIMVANTSAVLCVDNKHGVLFLPHVEYLEDGTWDDCFPICGSINSRLWEWEGYPPPKTWRTVVKNFTLGLWGYKDDSTGIARIVLLRAGVQIPFWVTTAGGMYRWLKRHGYGQRTRSTQSNTDIFTGPNQAARQAKPTSSGR